MIADIWTSFRSLPLWVQIWMPFILIPVNLAPLAFLDQPNAGLIALLSVGGMALNVPIMLAARGMSKAMAVPHVFLWSPMIVVAAFTHNSAEVLSPNYATFLIVLLIVDVISLAFDFNDTRHWWIERQAK